MEVGERLCKHWIAKETRVMETYHSEVPSNGQESNEAITPFIASSRLNISLIFEELAEADRTKDKINDD